MNSQAITLARHVIMNSSAQPEATNDLVVLLTQVGFAAKVIASQMHQAALVGLLGLTGETNVQGEKVKKLDQFGNEAFVRAFAHSGLVCTMVSEEMETALHMEDNCARGKYLLYVDPIDGSSNIDVNGIIGSIFSIHRRMEDKRHGTEEEVLRKGSEQVLAGYVMYGPSTVLVYTCGHGTHGFTLDPNIGEFLLSHEDIKIPTAGHTYSINVGRSREWPPHIHRLVDYLNNPDLHEGQPYTLRYVGSMVADLHRTLIDGGIFMYPADKRSPEGKLRLLYEVAPVAFVVEQAGGRATTGTRRILDIPPERMHQRCPLILGSPHDVGLYEKFAQEKEASKC